MTKSTVHYGLSKLVPYSLLNIFFFTIPAHDFGGWGTQ